MLMGTEFKLSVWSVISNQATPTQAMDQVFGGLAQLEKQISSWNPKSETSSINHNAGGEFTPVGTDLQELLNTSIIPFKDKDLKASIL